MSFDEGAWLATASAAPQILIAPAIAWLAVVFGLRRVMVWPSLLYVATTLVIPFARDYQLLLALHFIRGLLLGVFVPATIMIVLHNLPKHLWIVGLAAYSFRLSFTGNAGVSLVGFYVDQVGWHTAPVHSPDANRRTGSNHRLWGYWRSIPCRFLCLAGTPSMLATQWLKDVQSALEWRGAAQPTTGRALNTSFIHAGRASSPRVARTVRARGLPLERRPVSRTRDQSTRTSAESGARYTSQKNEVPFPQWEIVAVSDHSPRLVVGRTPYRGAPSTGRLKATVKLSSLES
ncbi:MAG: MFS transporter [Tardiphaga sp.]